MTMLRLLLLEDNSFEAEKIALTLQHGGVDCELLRVENYASFVTTLETDCFDLILADYSLPADGIAALEIARKRCPDVPFIFVADSLGEEVAIEALERGAAGFVLKHRLERLASCVQRALQQAQERRERTNLALRESEAKYHTLFESIDEGFCICEMLFDENDTPQDYRFLEVNPVFAKLTGLEQAVGKTARELVPDLEAFWIETYGRVVQTGEAVRFEQQSVVMNRWFDVNAFCVGEPQNRQFGVLFTNITKRKQAEVALQQGEARLRAVAANLPHGAIFIVNHELRYLLAEGKALEDAGVTSESLVGKTLWEVLDPALAACYEPYYRQTLAGEPFSLEHHSHNRYYASHGTPLYNDRGEVEAVLAVSYDITDRKQVEQERERFLAVGSDLQVITGNNGYFRWVSPSFERLLGWTPEEMTSRPWAEFVHPDDINTSVSEADHLFSGNETLAFENRYRHKDGSYRSLLWKAQPYPAEQVLYGAAVDITNLQQTEEQLRQSRAFLTHITDVAPIILYVYDLAETRNVWSNNNLSLVLGYAPDEVQAMGENLLSQLLHPEDAKRYPAHFERLCRLLPDEIAEFEYRMRHKDGSWHWLSSREMAYLRHDDGTVMQIVGAAHDITKRKRAEAELQQREAELRLVTNTVPALISFVDSNQCYRFNNQAYEAWFEHSAAEIYGKHLQDVLGEVAYAAIRPYVEQVLSGEQVTFESQVHYKNAGTRYISATYAPRLSPQGSVEGFVALVSDVSERKQAEKKLQRAAELDAFRVSLADALRPLADPVEVQATASRVLGQYLGANRVAYFEVRGADYIVERDYVNGAEALSGNYPIDSFGPDLLAAYRTGRAVSASNVATDSNLSPKQRSAYAAIQIGAYIGIPLIKEGKFVAGLAVHTIEPRGWTPDEVSLVEEVAERTWAAVERARAEAALRDSENRFRMAIESAQLGTWDWNLVTHQLIWDEACKAMFGLPPEAESSIEVFFAGLHPDDRDRLEQVVQWALNPASRGKYDVEYRTIGIQDGVERWIAARGQVYFDSANNPQRFVGTVLNITEQKQIEAEREQLFAREQAAREVADRANRIKDEFLAVLSHELRSPLSPILGWSKLLQSGKLDEARTKQALTTIEKNARLQAELIEDLLDISRILRGKLSLTVSSVNLASVIQAAIETVRLSAEAKSIHIEIGLDPAVRQVSGDSTRLQQVVWNLLSNAVKFTPPNGQVTVQLEQVDYQAQITVSDTGKGIAPAFLPYVFDYFRQEDGATTRKFGGLGLGLAIVRHLVELHGGTIEVDSPGEGLGATFTVRLPVMLTQPTVDQAPQSFASSLSLKDIQVLVVDDDTDTRDFIEFLLEQAGAKVMTAASAGEGFTALLRSKPDVLLSDIGMPDMDGYMLMQQIRTLPPEQGGTVPAIALTAYAGELDQRQALSVGFQQHVPKPVEPEALVEVIANLLNHST